MRIILLLTLIVLFTGSAFCQEPPKDASKIEVAGVTFREVVNNLLDQNYYIDKIDSNYQTVKTEAHNSLIIYARVKDSTAILTCWYEDKQVRNDKSLESAFFKLLNIFALSFKKPIEYKK